MRTNDPRDRSRSVDAKCPCHGYNVCPDDSGVVTQPREYVRCLACRLVLPSWHARAHFAQCAGDRDHNGYVLALSRPHIFD